MLLGSLRVLFREETEARGSIVDVDVDVDDVEAWWWWGVGVGVGLRGSMGRSLWVCGGEGWVLGVEVVGLGLMAVYE